MWQHCEPRKEGCEICAALTALTAIADRFSCLHALENAVLRAAGRRCVASGRVDFAEDADKRTSLM